MFEKNDNTGKIIIRRVNLDIIKFHDIHDTNEACVESLENKPGNASEIFALLCQ